MLSRFQRGRKKRLANRSTSCTIPRKKLECKFQGEKGQHIMLNLSKIKQWFDCYQVLDKFFSQIMVDSIKLWLIKKLPKLCTEFFS